MTGDLTEAQDLTQEAFARAWSSWRRLQRYEHPEAWLRLVVTRLATDRWRWLALRRAQPAPRDTPVLRFDAEVNDAMTVVKGNTIYARWADTGNQESVAAIDLGTLRPLRGPVKVGRFIGPHMIWVSPGAVLVSATKGSVADQLVALDPGTGNVMWRRDYAFEFDRLLLYDDVAVVSLTGTRQVAALDLRSGAMRWTSQWTERPLTMTSIRGFEEVSERGGYGSLPAPADRRFVTRQADGRIQLRDVGSDGLLSEWHAVTGSVASEIGFNGNLYLGGNDGAFETSLDRGASRQLYTGEVRRITPCGPTLICVIGKQLTAIDTVSGRQLWSVPYLWTKGDVFATNTAIQARTGESSYAIYDPTGRTLRTVNGTAHFADDEHLLVWEKEGTLSAYSVVTDERTVLGRVKWAICSWTRTMLACPTAQGISVWRYRTG